MVHLCDYYKCRLDACHLFVLKELAVKINHEVENSKSSLSFKKKNDICKLV